MNSNREDYLKVILEEGGMERLVQNRVLAEKLGVAGGSVSEMLIKLMEANLIEYTPYKGSKLTEKGISVCQGIVRNHRLWEVFLIRHLKYSWREAHEEAHILEHITTQRMSARLDEFLNFPEVCPHGEYIPREKNSLINKVGLRSLTDLDKGEEGRLSKIIEDGDLLDYIEGKGVQIGGKIKMLLKDEYEGPVTFEQSNKHITISYKAANKMYVE